MYAIRDLYDAIDDLSFITEINLKNEVCIKKEFVIRVLKFFLHYKLYLNKREIDKNQTTKTVI